MSVRRSEGVVHVINETGKRGTAKLGVDGGSLLSFLPTEENPARWKVSALLPAFPRIELGKVWPK